MPEDWDLTSLAPENLTFWTRGNRPSQEVLGIDKSTALLHLKALHLLSDRILGAASFYFESPIARGIIDNQAAVLVAREDLLLYVSDDVENFLDHGMSKAEKNSSTLKSYSDRENIRLLGEKLDRSAAILRRPSQDISAILVELWLQDLSSDAHGSVGAIAQSLDGSNEPGKWFDLLTRVALDRRSDFVWETVEPSLVENGCSRAAMRGLRQRLLRLYNQVAADAVGSSSDAPSQAVATSPGGYSAQFDTALLLLCFDSLGLLEVFEDLSMEQVVELKKSIGWQLFHSFYLNLLGYATRRGEMKLARLSREASERVSHQSEQPANRAEFIAAFSQMLSLVPLPSPKGGFDELADKLFSVSEAFGDSVFELFENAIEQLSEPTTVRPKSRSRLDRKGTKLMQLRAFIVHGTDLPAALELKDYLQNTLEMPQPLILAQTPNSGRTIIEKFEDVAATVDIVFVLMTADDPIHGTDEYMARQNVLFELGYFVGVLGRRTGRVLLLKKSQVRMPSDLSGVVYIDISNGIPAAGEEIRRELTEVEPGGD